MRYAGTERDEDGPWLRIGSLEVTTTVAVLLVWAAMIVVWAAEGPGRAVSRQLWLLTDSVAVGEVWRVVTWPFAHASFGLWDIINAAVFWFFGTDLERQTGRRSFAVLLAWTVVAIGVAATIFGSLLGSPTLITDLDLLGLAVVILYCIEHPSRPFFFGIPAWVVAAVIATIEIVNDLGNRDWARLLGVLAASVVVALAAKRAGLLSMYDRVPEVRLPGAEARAERRTRKRRGAQTPAGRSSGSASGGGVTGRFRRREEAEILEMPTQPRPRPRPTPVVPDDVNADDVALDALLDKISANGIDSLSDAERQQLDEIRARRRKD